MRTRLLIALVLTVLGGCVYRMKIQQGNLLDEPVVAQLKEGMTRSQVRYLLGTPMVPDAFDNERWDYLYYMKAGRLGAPQKHRLTVYFKEDKVARTESEGAPVILASNERTAALKPKRGLWSRLFHRARAAPAPAAQP